MSTPCSAKGSDNACRAASSLSRPMPSRPWPKRGQKEASMAFKCEGRPGVPATTSRNGAAAPRTCWLVFRSAAPASRGSVCASSSSTTSGRRRQRAISAASKSRGPLPRVHSAVPLDMVPILRGRSFASRRRGASASTSAARSARALGVSDKTSTSGSFSAQACWNQPNSAVLPLPRGPNNTTLCGGASPWLTPARQRRSTACSAVRPVRAGGMAPSPALKTHVVAAFMRSAVYACGEAANAVGRGAVFVSRRVWV